MSNKEDEKITELPTRKCLRCGHVWVPRKAEIMVCPKCRSPYWNRERIRKIKGGRK